MARYELRAIYKINGKENVYYARLLTLMVYSSLFMEKYAKKIFLIETMKIGHRVKFMG